MITGPQHRPAQSTQSGHREAVATYSLFPFLSSKRIKPASSTLSRDAVDRALERCSNQRQSVPGHRRRTVGREASPSPGGFEEGRMGLTDLHTRHFHTSLPLSAESRPWRMPPASRSVAAVDARHRADCSRAGVAGAAIAFLRPRLVGVAFADPAAVTAAPAIRLTTRINRQARRSSALHAGCGEYERPRSLSEAGK
jgi:hypothetical protein